MLFHKTDVVLLDMTVEQTIKFFVLGAIAAPEVFPTKESL
jgi:uncharacterized membrane protein